MPSLNAIISGDARPLEKELNRGANAAQTAAKRIQTALSTDALFLERQISAAKRAGVEWGQYDAQLKKVQTDLAKVNRELATQETLSAGGPAAASAGPAAAGAGGKLAGKIAKGAGHMEGVGGIVTELLVVSRELLNGNFSRLPGSISILVQRFGLLKVIISGVGLAWTAAIGGIIGGITIFYHRVNSLAEKLTGLKLPDFKTEHIPTYLNAANQAVEAWKDINEASRAAAESYDSVTAAAERHLEVLREEFNHKKKIMEIDKANALANIHDPIKRAEIEKKFRVDEAKLAKEQRDTELKANLQKQKDLENEVYAKKAQADAIKVSSVSADEERSKKLKEDAAAARAEIERFNAKEQQNKSTIAGRIGAGGTLAPLVAGAAALGAKETAAEQEADLKRRRESTAKIAESERYDNARGERDRLRKRKEELDKIAAEAAKAATTLKYENQNRVQVNAKKDKDEMSEATMTREEEMRRKGAGLPSLTHNQHIGAYIGGPSVSLLTEAKTTNRHLSSIDRKLGSMNRLTPAGNSRDVNYGHP